MNARYRELTAASIKREIDPHDFYLREQHLERFNSKSREWAEAGLCPFHDDRAAGSFRIHLQSGAYNCFSCGTKGGDIIAFTQAKYGLSFPEVLDQLSNEWGVY